MRSLAIDRGFHRLFMLGALLAACLTLCGCGDKLLERSYSSVAPHSAAYWENEDADTLRAENYQDLVNALLLLVGEHSEDGVVRIYGDAQNKASMASDACVEVQKETPTGAFLLDYITYEGKAESAYYELKVRFGYRRTAEELSAIVNATSTEALPDLLRAAIKAGHGSVAIRLGYLGTDREGVMALVSAVHDEVYPPAQPEIESEPEEGEEPEGEGETSEDGTAETLAPTDETRETGEGTENEGPEGELPEGEEPESVETEPPEPEYDISPWSVLFYPDNERPGIVEVLLPENG
ncbi:MAG: hypothetical protein J5449_11495 [Oscillospiraceae bacterium]|nr:hypothetical protein [Oscillospiraceae bacterium]